MRLSASGHRGPKGARGFTLLELLFVLGIVTLMAVTEMQEKAAQIEQARARQLGIQLYQYNNAVRSYIAENPGATSSHTGTGWLKASSCGGTSAKDYLPCSYPEQLPLGGLTLQTTLSSSGGATTARTTLPALTLAGKLRPDLAGLAALTASGGAVNSLLPTLATTDASFTSNPLSAVITAEASTRADNDVWLRTDGGNSMHANLNFDSANAAARNITGVNRITAIAGSVLTLGRGGLAGNVLIDANTEVIGVLTARSNLAVQGNAVVNGDFMASKNASVGVDLGVQRDTSIGRNLTVQSNAAVKGSQQIDGVLTVGLGTTIGGDLSARYIAARAGITAKDNIIADRNIQGGDVVAVNAAQAPIYYDRNDFNYYVDPASTSSMNIIHADVVRDRSDPNFFLDPSSSSRLNYVKMVAANLDGSWAVDAPCTTKNVGTTATGELLSCVQGRWKKPGSDGGGAFWWAVGTHNRQFCFLGQCQTNPRTGDYSCPAGYVAIGGIVGQAYRLDQWDQTTHYYTCVKS